MMSRSTNREYSSTDISSVNGYRTLARISKATSAAQPQSACCPSENRSKKYESQKDSISEVTLNDSIYSSETTPQRKVIKCKDTNDEELITYHLKLKPESLHYTYASTAPKKIVYAETHSDYQETSRTYHGKKVLPIRNSSFLQNCQQENKSYDEKTTNCRPVINLHTVEFIERTIDKNNRLKRLVRDIVEAREKEKQLEAWNNYINELKNKHAYNYYEYLDVPKKYQIECDNAPFRNNLPGRCTSTRPWSSVNNDYCDVTKHSDYIMNLYPNEISCYPISSAAHRPRNTNNVPLKKSYLKTEYIINAEEGNPQKRKRKQLSSDEVRNISAQTSAGTGATLNNTSLKNNNRNAMKDEIEGYEPCVCAGESVRDSGTNTDKGEQDTMTGVTSKACFCNKDQEVSHKTRNGTKDEIEGYEPCVCAGEPVRDSGTNTSKVEQETLTVVTPKACLCNKGQERKQHELEKSATYNNRNQERSATYEHEFDRTAHELGRTASYSNKNQEIEQNEIGRTATYVTVKEKMTKLKEELEESKTCDNSFGIIEEKLDHIISTMNDLLSEVKLRITEMNAEKFDSATSTTFPHINDKYENCVAHQLLEQEINIREEDNVNQNERYDFDLFKRDKKTINTVQFTPILTPIEKMILLNTILTPITADDKAQNNTITTPTENKNKLNSLYISLLHKKEEDIKVSENENTANNNDVTANLRDQIPCIDAKSSKVADIPEKLERKSSRLRADSSNKLTRTQNKDCSVSDVSKSDGEPQPSTERSVIELKRASRTFMESLNKSGPNLTDDEIKKNSETFSSRLKKKFSSKVQYEKFSKEEKQQVSSIPEDKKVKKENSDPNHPDNTKNYSKNKKDQEFCCVYANLRSIPRPQYRHASVTASLDRKNSNATEIILDVYYSNNDGNDQTINKLVHRAVSRIDETTLNTSGKSNKTKLRIAVDRAVSKIDENVFSVNYQQNCVSVDRAVSKIDDIIKEEINKSNQAKKDINEILNREFTNNYGVQITFELPTKERGTEVTDSLSKTRVSNASASQGKIYYGRPSRTSPLTISAVNTDPMSLLGLFRLSTNTMRQLLTFINFDYSSYLPSVSRALPAVSEAVQYLCHVCGATFRRPSELSNHMKDHNLNSAKDCCVCRHILQLRQRKPGVFACRFCGQCFTRAYCCELHERTCGRRRGRRLDVSDSRAILT